MVIGSTAGLLPNSFGWLYVIFPIESLGYLSNLTQSIMTRSWGLASLSLGIFCAMLAKYGAHGILDLQRPWRLVLFVGFVFIGLLGGFRSVLIIYIMTFGLLLYLEGLLRTRLLPAILLTVILSGALLAAFATSLPLSVQRSLAVLPIPIDPIAKRDAQGSSEWRIRMWKSVLPEIPENLLIGKGYLFSSTDDWLVQFNRGEEAARGSELVGDYHNGPLSVILPFGLPGVAAFAWFLIAAGKVLYRNYKFGIPEYRIINRFLFAYFMARMIFFFAVFGSLYSDLALFTGMVGLSVSLNGGVAQPESEPLPQFVLGERERGVPDEAEPQPVA
jgi:O-antigen ligase